MVRTTGPIFGSRTFRIRKRFGVVRLSSQRVIPAVSVLLFVVGSACLWFASVVEAGVTQWSPVGAMKQVSTGQYYTCAIGFDNKAYCWGDDTYGQLGNNSISQSNVPVAVDTSGVLSGKTILSIATGDNHTCVIASDNNAYCWGDDTYGQLGNNSISQSNVPVAVDTSGVLSGKTILSISAGYSTTCAIASDNKAYCWGDDSVGQLGDNNPMTQSTVPVAVDTSGVLSGKTILSIATGGGHVCAVASDNKAYCWGWNGSGQVGDNSIAERDVPVAVDTSGVLSGKTILSIATGGSHTCAIASDNNAYCWGGGNSYGQLGNGSYASSMIPVAVINGSGPLSGKTIRAISAGFGHTCVVASDSQLYCWGAGSFGQLGNNFTVKNSSPVSVYTSGALSGKTLSAISTGSADNEHTCAIGSDNLVYCWGYNGSGELGDNTTTQRSVPVLVRTTGSLATGDYRLYGNADSLTPGSPFAVTDAPVTLAGGVTDFRLRTGIKSLSSIKQVSSGNSHTCAVTIDGLAYCWGQNTYGQLGNNSTTQSNVPVAVDTSGVLSGKTILSVSAGTYNSCAIASDNKAYCWGAGNFGQLGNNTTSQSSVPVAVDTTGVLSGKTVLSMAVGYQHTCAIASDNLVYCWGTDSSGQLGNNSTTQSNVPVAVDTSGVLSGKTIRSIALGGYNASEHTCVIASDGLAYCWGYNASGQLGNNSTTQSNVPVAVNTAGVLSGKTVRSVSAGSYHACVVASDNLAYCWGVNSSGQLGNNSTTQSNVPVAVDTSGVLSGKTIRSIAAGGLLSNGHTCVVASDSLAYCWGSNSAGQLGNSSTTDSHVPVAVTTSGALSGKTVSSMSSGNYQVCIVASDSLVYCWGSNSAGQLGNNMAGTYNSAPVAVTNSGVLSGKTLLATSAGVGHTCAIASDNLAYCWGLNTNGQLGNNSTTTSTVPVAVSTSGVLSGKTILSISAGNAYTCVVASDNKAYCWGLNTNGRLGNNSTTQSLVPVAVDTSGVLSGKTILSISTGSAHTCAIASDNLAYCWGDNSTYGKLGNNSTAQSLVPVAVDTTGVLSGKTILSISLGTNNTCVIASNNLAYCWGYSGNGELGNNGAATSLVPSAVYTAGVLSGKTILSISVGGAHTCVIASDNQAYCWGYNNNGQRGNNSTSTTLVPTAVYTAGVLSGKTILSITSGGLSGTNEHTCAIASDNLAYCWGYNGSGQLGNNSATQSTVPVAVTTSGSFSGKTVLSISAGQIHACAIASDNQAYCWGDGSSGRLGNASTGQSTVPVATLTSYMSGPRLYAGDNTFKLQYAQLSAATCSAQTTGFADVTGASTIAYNDNPSVSNGVGISSTGNDPVAAANATMQTYQDASGTFTNVNTIDPGKTGLWDFSLKANGVSANTSYCLRMTYGDGTAMESSTAYPEVRILPANLSLGFFDAGGSPLSKPTFSFGGATVSTGSYQSTAGTFSTSAAKLRVFNNLATNGWSVSLAATGGATAAWDRADHLAKYDFNDSGAGATDTGGDADSYGGQLSVNPAAGAVSSPCSLTGLSVGSSANFIEGSQDSITLFNASSGAAMNCNWDYTGASLTQTIPALQAAGTYTIDITATVVAL